MEVLVARSCGAGKEEVASWEAYPWEGCVEEGPVTLHLVASVTLFDSSAAVRAKLFRSSAMTQRPTPFLPSLDYYDDCLFGQLVSLTQLAQCWCWWLRLVKSKDPCCYFGCCCCCCCCCCCLLPLLRLYFEEFCYGRETIEVCGFWLAKQAILSRLRAWRLLEVTFCECGWWIECSEQQQCMRKSPVWPETKLPVLYVSERVLTVDEREGSSLPSSCFSPRISLVSSYSSMIPQELAVRMTFWERSRPKCECKEQKEGRGFHNIRIPIHPLYDFGHLSIG